MASTTLRRQQEERARAGTPAPAPAPAPPHPLLSSRDVLADLVFARLDAASLGRAACVFAPWRDLIRLHCSGLWTAHLHAQFAGGRSAEAARAVSAAAGSSSPYAAFSRLANAAVGGKPTNLPLATHALYLSRFEAAKASIVSWRLRLEIACAGEEGEQPPRPRPRQEGGGGNGGGNGGGGERRAPPGGASAGAGRPNFSPHFRAPRTPGDDDRVDARAPPRLVRSGAPWTSQSEEQAWTTLGIVELAADRENARMARGGAPAPQGAEQRGRCACFRALGRPLETPQSLWVRFKLPRVVVDGVGHMFDRGLVDTVLEARVLVAAPAPAAGGAPPPVRGASANKSAAGAEEEEEEEKEWVAVARCPRFHVPRGNDRRCVHMSHLFGFYAFEPSEDEEDDLDDDEDGGGGDLPDASVAALSKQAINSVADAVWWRDMPAEGWKPRVWRSLVRDAAERRRWEEADTREADGGHPGARRAGRDGRSFPASAEPRAVRVLAYVHFEQLLTALEGGQQRAGPAGGGAAAAAAAASSSPSASAPSAAAPASALAPPSPFVPLRPPARWPVVYGACMSRARQAMRYALHHAWPPARAADAASASSARPPASAPSTGGYLLVASCFRMHNPVKQRAADAVAAAAAAVSRGRPAPAPAPEGGAHLGTAALRLYLSAPIGATGPGGRGRDYGAAQRLGDAASAADAVVRDFGPGGRGNGFVLWSWLQRLPEMAGAIKAAAEAWLGAKVNPTMGRATAAAGKRRQDDENAALCREVRERAVHSLLGGSGRVILSVGEGALDAVVAVPGVPDGPTLPLLAKLAGALEDGSACLVSSPYGGEPLSPEGALYAQLMRLQAAAPDELAAAAAAANPSGGSNGQWQQQQQPQKKRPRPSFDAAAAAAPTTNLKAAVFAGEGALAAFATTAASAGTLMDISLYDPSGRLLLGRGGCELWLSSYADALDEPATAAAAAAAAVACRGDGPAAPLLSSLAVLDRLRKARDASFIRCPMMTDGGWYGTAPDTVSEWPAQCEEDEPLQDQPVVLLFRVEDNQHPRDVPPAPSGETSVCLSVSPAAWGGLHGAAVPPKGMVSAGEDRGLVYEGEAEGGRGWGTKPPPPPGRGAHDDADEGRAWWGEEEELGDGSGRRVAFRRPWFPRPLRSWGL